MVFVDLSPSAHGRQEKDEPFTIDRPLLLKAAT